MSTEFKLKNFTTEEIKNELRRRNGKFLDQDLNSSLEFKLSSFGTQELEEELKRREHKI